MARKASALAQRREKDGVGLAAVQSAITGGAGTVCVMPEHVAATPRLRECWEVLVGDGSAYTQADAPIIEQLAFNYLLMQDCRDQLIDERGVTHLYIEHEDEDGFTQIIPNPAYKTLSKLTQDSLKLADVLGLTPAARLRFGLTQANTNAINVSIADTIYKALGKNV